MDELGAQFESWLASREQNITNENRLIHSIVVKSDTANTTIMMKGSRFLTVPTSMIAEKLKIGDLISSFPIENTEFENSELKLDKHAKPPIEIFQENDAAHVLAAVPCYKWRNPNNPYNKWIDTDEMNVTAWSPDLGQIWDPEDLSADFSKNIIFWAKVQYFENEEGKKKWQIVEIARCLDVELRKRIVEAPWNLLTNEEKPKSIHAKKKEIKKERRLKQKETTSKCDEPSLFKNVKAFIVEIRLEVGTKRYFALQDWQILTEMKVQNTEDEKMLRAGRAVVIRVNKAENISQFQNVDNLPLQYVEFTTCQLEVEGIIIEQMLLRFFVGDLNEIEIAGDFVTVNNNIIGKNIKVPLSAIEGFLEEGKTMNDVEAVCAFGKFDRRTLKWKFSEIEYLRYED